MVLCRFLSHAIFASEITNKKYDYENYKILFDDSLCIGAGGVQ